MMNKKKLYVCRRCALEAPTCCRLGPDQPTGGGGGYDCFPLSETERGRIAAALAEAAVKKTASEARALLQAARQAVDALTEQAGWHVPEVNSARFVKAMRNLFPAEKTRIGAIFPQGGAHLRLSLGPGGGCAFLSERGCTLPRQARPWFCRIFPFWVVGGTLQCFTAEDCLALREHGGNCLALLGIFDSSPHEVMDHYKALRRDWGIDSAP